MKFILPGTHGTFHPWIPPPGISDDILIQIRRDLIDIIAKALATQITVSHSRQSSDACSEVDNAEQSITPNEVLTDATKEIMREAKRPV